MWSKEYAHKFEEEIRNNPEPRMKYKDSRAIYDLKHMLSTSAELYADNPAFWVKDTHESPYRSISYKDAKREVDELGTALVEDLGLLGKRVGVIGANCYEWAISYLAVTCGVGAVVPLDKELSAEEIEKFVHESEIEAIIYADKSKKLFDGLRGKENALKHYINMHIDEDRGEGAEKELSLKTLINRGAFHLEAGRHTYLDATIDPNEMGVLLFTSGTTGTSKGVMLSHGNLCCDLMIAPTVLKVNDWDVFFSVLPLHHTYACTDDFLMPLYKGASIAYCEGLKYIVKNLEEARPTMFLGVPALFENLYSKIWQNAKKSGKDKLLRKVIAVNKYTKKIGLDLGNIFFKQIRALFGGRMRMMISGGAAIDPEVLRGIQAFGVQALQGYGLTECAPICALNPDTDWKDDAAGFIIPGLDGKIHNPDPETGIGEFCAKGENVMLGYYRNPEATAEVIRDGWFHTGDLGYIDEDRYVHLTGRSKNVIIAKNGKNVYPEELEYQLGRLDIVAESMVFGKDSEKRDEVIIVASIFPNEEELVEVLGEGYDKQAVEDLLWSKIDVINKDLPFYKKIKKVIIRDKDFEKNTSKKIKRFVESNKEG